MSHTQDISYTIFNHLKESIITNKLKGGQKINERKIAELCEVSIAPITEAVFMQGWRADEHQHQFQRYSLAQFYALGNPGSLKEHEEILMALKAKIKRQLKGLLEKHWESFLRPSRFEV